jgi:glycosidase/fibronectin type 3 domain-containing protein
MKAIRLPLAIFLALSLFLSPAASLAQAPTQEIIQSSPPTVDGVVDAEYGPAVATDPAGDSQGGNPVDLTNLWVTQDATHYYFAFEVNTEFATNNWGKYAIYLDTTGDSNGATSDAWGRAVVAADPHKPEYAIYTYVDSLPYGIEDVPLYVWNGINWENSLTVDAAAIGSGSTSIIEYSVSKSKLGYPEKLWVEVWSTGENGGDNAQDTINFPSNDWQASDWGSLATLSVSTPILLVNGVIEPTYGYPIAADPSGDGNGNAVMDLLGFWAAEDASQYYFAYTINSDIAVTNWGKYALYIDTSNDAEGATSDAWGRNVVVNDPHKPEFGIYTWVDDAPYGPEDTQFWAWDGSAWSLPGGVNEAALMGGAPSVIEWAVEKNRLGNPDTLWLEVWDTGNSGGDNAQDTINDPADEWNATDWSTQAVLSVSTQFPVSTEPPVAGHDNDVWWDFLGHNSRDTLYRTPGGPVTTGTDVILRLRAAANDLTEAKLRLYNDRTNVQSILPMSVAYSDGTYDWWEVTVPASADPTVYWYRFIVIDGTDTDYYEDDAARTMGWGQAFDETQDYSYQLTVYAPDFETPDWIKNAIVYQVFPDRFRDGDPDNNKPAGTFFYDEPGGTVYRSLDAEENWNTVICDPRGDDDCAGTYSKNFYGGDLAGLISQLDYLQALGVNTIYLNPIFESPSNHGYDTTDYMAINPMFGTQAEFEALVSALQTREMHLILDGVFNHVSSDSIYFDRYSNFDEVGACESNTSPYRSWFYFTDVNPGIGPCVGSDGKPGGATYESWWGYDSLPKLNSSNPEVRALIWDYDTDATETVAGYWMQDADGWRLDVGGDVDPGTLNDTINDYWEGFRNTVHTVNPQGYITGEEWGIANSWLLGGEWDAVMNYQFSSAVLSLWRDTTFTDNDHNAGSSAGPLAPLSMSQFDERILNLQERYAPEALAAMMNLFGSHDTNRALFMLDENTNTLEPSDYLNPDYDWTPAIDKLKGAVAVQMTMPGAPTIYYGDEVGLVGPVAKDGSGVWQDDPYNRQPYPWLDESGTPYYTHLQTQTTQDALRIYYMALATARNAHPALRTGDFRTLLCDDTDMLYAYGRNLPGEDSAIVLINRGTTPQMATLDVAGYLPNNAAYGDVFSSAIYIVTDGQLQDVSVQANSALVLVLKDNTQMAPPDPVTSLVVDGVSAWSVALDWNDPESEPDDYLVYRSNFSGGGYEVIGLNTESFFNDTTVVPGTRYYYMVVSRDTTTGLYSGPSNEVNALPAYTIDWANLQFPSSIVDHVVGLTPTVNIYGQVWISGVTVLPGPAPTLVAQVGFGPDGSSPEGNLDWIWSGTVFNGQSSENDEFVGNLIPEQIGTYDYAYRYTTTNGENWIYADLDGTGNGYLPAQAGSLSVIASTDIIPPSAPVLSIADWGAGFIDLSWTASTDDVEVYAYDIYRSTDNITFTKTDRVLAPTLTYTDTTVVTDQLYYYFLIALDTSFNHSLPSNTVSQTAEAKMVSLTMDITVPDFTPGTVFLTRFINPDGTVGNWDSAATALTKISDTLWRGTFDILDGTAFAFKFARGSWDTVMKDADGNTEIADLPITVTYGSSGTQTYTYTVLNWRDPIVVDTSPNDGDVDVPVDASIVVTWSQVLPESSCPDVWVEPNPADLIPVTCGFNPAIYEMTITPTNNLPWGADISVGLSGLVDAGGDTQQVSFPLTFTTEYLKVFLPVIFR